MNSSANRLANTAVVLALASLVGACYSTDVASSRAAASPELYNATAGRYYGAHYRPFVWGGGSPTIALGRHNHTEKW